jgi:hypothetical protein
MAVGTRVVEVVDSGPHDGAATLLQQRRELVGEPGLARSVAAVHGDEQRPLQVGQRVRDAGEGRDPCGHHSSVPRTWAPPGGRRTMKSQTSP